MELKTSEHLSIQTEQYEKYERRVDTRRQYYAAFCMSLLSFAYGTTSGWPSSAMIILESEDTPLDSGPINADQIGWIASGIGIGGFFANLFFGWMSERVGRRNALYCAVIPQILSWIFIYCARMPIYLIIARILGGMSGGGVFAILPTYIAEIADDSIRGTLGSFLVLFCNLGLLFAYACGGFFDYFKVPYIMLTFSAAFILLFVKFPDSPASLYKRKHFSEAEESIIYYNSYKTFSKEAKETIQKNLNKLQSIEGSDNLSLKEILQSRASKKALLYGVVLMALNQFSGGFAMCNFTASIFKQSGSSLSPILSSLIIATIQIFGALSATFFVERTGRKSIMIISSFGMSIGLIVLGTYALIQSHGEDMTAYNFIPLMSFSFLIFSANLGVLTLPFLIISEIAPQKIRGFASTFCMSFCWIFVFIVIKYLPTLIETLGMHGAVYIFAINAFIGGLFIIKYIPETKGKSSDEIMKIMEK